MWDIFEEESLYLHINKPTATKLLLWVYIWKLVN